MNRSRLPTIAAALFLQLSAAAVEAAPVATDQQLAADLSAQRWSALEAAARARWQQDQADDLAFWYLGMAAKDQESSRRELIPQAEQCVTARPRSARCHHVLGALLSAQAASGGASSGLKLAGRIKTHYARAVELDPSSWMYRRDLNQFYLFAPGLIGGSVRKARLNAETFARIHPAIGRILNADILSYEKEFAEAEKLLAQVEPGHDLEVRDALRESTSNLGLALLEKQQPASAERLSRRALAIDPQYGPAHFALGRALLEQQKLDDAIVSLQRSLELDSHSRAHYRLGLAYEAKGQHESARTMFEAFLRYRPEGRQADDARARLTRIKPAGSLP